MIFAYAEVAQPVEQRTENPCVDGSIPSLGTMNRKESRLIVDRSEAGFLFENDKCGTSAEFLFTDLLHRKTLPCRRT